MSVYVPADLRRQVRDRFANRCAYRHTQEDLTVAIFELEHVVPRSAGGGTVFANLCLACPACKGYKADRTVAADPEMQQEVALFHPQRDEWTDHFAWNDDATEVTALTTTGRATIAALRMNRAQPRVRRTWAAMGEHAPDNRIESGCRTAVSAGSGGYRNKTRTDRAENAGLFQRNVTPT